MNQEKASFQQNNSLPLSNLITKQLQGLSPIQTIMKMAEPQNIVHMGLDPKNIISFGGGWCNHPAPNKLQRIYKDIATDKNLFHQSGRYSSITGLLSCREQLCRFEQEIYDVQPLCSDNILLGQSSTQLFHDLLRVLADPGDDVCLLDPTYANYANSITCALPKSRIHFISALDPQNWTYLEQPEKSLEQLKEYCSQGAKICVIPVPDNPTSQIPSDSFLRSVREILADHQGFLVLDFAYKALWFHNMPSCYSWSPETYPNLISIHSNSKWLSSLGRRLGWIEAPTPIVNGMEKINESMLLSPDTLHSMATAEYLETGLSDGSLKTYIKNTRFLYKKTADVLIEMIDEELGWKYLTPDGGLYTCCPTPNDENPMTFIQRILKNTGVLLIPGIGFGPSMNHAIRLSYGPLCQNTALIRKGIKRISQYLS